MYRSTVAIAVLGQDSAACVAYDRVMTYLATTVTGGATTTYRRPSTGRTVTAVGFDGSRVLWIDCQASGLTPCAVRKRQNGVTTTASSGVDRARRYSS